AFFQADPHDAGTVFGFKGADFAESQPERLDRGAGAAQRARRFLNSVGGSLSQESQSKVHALGPDPASFGIGLPEGAHRPANPVDAILGWKDGDEKSHAALELKPGGTGTPQKRPLEWRRFRPRSHKFSRIP